MRDHEQGHALLGVKPFQEFHHLLAGGRVEVAGRLVGQQQRRARHGSACDRHPLALPTRKLRRTVRGAIAQVHRGQCFANSATPLGGRHSGQDQGQFDVLCGAQPRDQMKKTGI